MSRIRTALVGTVAAGLLLMSVGVARADNLHVSDLTVAGNFTTTPGDPATVSYRLNASSGQGDQQPGCNASDGTAAAVSINVPAGVTAVPSSLSFNACDVAKNVSFTAAAVGNYEITAVVADSGSPDPASYNEQPAKFTLRVVAPADTTPPVITAPDIVKEATGELTSVTYAAFAIDAVDGPRVVTFDKTGPFAVGVHTITVTAGDLSGNVATKTFTVTITAPPVVVDQAPVITVSDIVKEATGPTTPVTFNATASDNEDGDLTSSITYSPSGPFTVGVRNVIASVTDSAGHHVTKLFKVTIKDTTPPVLPDLEDITEEATGPSGAVATFGPANATDLVDGNVPVVFTPLSGSTFALGSTDVYYTATDAAGNIAANKSFKVNVVDTTPPVLPVLPALNLSATSAQGAVGTWDPAFANDTVDGLVPVVFDNHQSGETFPLGPTTINFHATDEAGNTSTGSFNVYVTVPCANGLNPPINNDGSSVFKLGSTVPVKFNCFSGLNAKLNWTKVDSSPDGPVNEPASSNPANDGNLFRYDATAGQYIFNLGTKNLSQGSWVLHVTLGDGVDHTTNINLRK